MAINPYIQDAYRVYSWTIEGDQQIHTAEQGQLMIPVRGVVEPAAKNQHYLMQAAVPPQPAGVLHSRFTSGPRLVKILDGDPLTTSPIDFNGTISLRLTSTLNLLGVGSAIRVIGDRVFIATHVRKNGELSWQNLSGNDTSPEDYQKWSPVFLREYRAKPPGVFTTTHMWPLYTRAGVPIEDVEELGSCAEIIESPSEQLDTDQDTTETDSYPGQWDRPVIVSEAAARVEQKRAIRQAEAERLAAKQEALRTMNDVLSRQTANTNHRGEGIA